MSQMRQSFFMPPPPSDYFLAATLISIVAPRQVSCYADSHVGGDTPSRYMPLDAIWLITDVRWRQTLPYDFLRYYCFIRIRHRPSLSPSRRCFIECLHLADRFD